MTNPLILGRQADRAIRLRRTLEYVSARDLAGVRPRVSSPADVICLDLEDTVPPGDKSSAREVLRQAMSICDFGEREIIVRINGYGTEDHVKDLETCAALGVHGVALPKVSDLESVDVARRIMGDRLVPLWCMIESPAGLQRAAEIAMQEGVTALLVGGYDLAESLGIVRTKMKGLMYHYAPIVVAAKAAGISAVGPVAVDDVDDDTLGFDGRSCYIGQDIAAINRRFTPSEADVQIARDILEKGGVYGEHLDHARRLVEFAELARARDVVIANKT